MSVRWISLSASICLILLLVTAAPVLAENYDDLRVAWSNTYDYYDFHRSVYQEPVTFNVSADGSCFITGAMTDSGEIGHYEPGAVAQAYVVKVDKTGRRLWNTTLPPAVKNKGVAVLGTSDGGCLVVREREQNYSYHDYDVARLDAAGNLKWIEAMPTSEGLKATAEHTGGKFLTFGGLAQTSDGGYVATFSSIRDGQYKDFIHDYKFVNIAQLVNLRDIYVVRLDPQGNVTWVKTITGKFDQQASDVVPTADGGFLVVGSTTSYYSNTGDQKLDFRNTYELNIKGEQIRVYERTDLPEGYNGALTTTINQDDVLLVKLNSTGEVEWQKTYGGYGPQYGVTALPEAQDIVVLGYGFSDRLTPAFNGSDGADRVPLYDVYLLKVSPSGEPIWEQKYSVNNSTSYRLAATGLFPSGRDYVVIGKDAADYDRDGNTSFFISTTDSEGRPLSLKTLTADHTLLNAEQAYPGEYLVLTKYLGTPELTNLGGSVGGAGASSPGAGSGGGPCLPAALTILLVTLCLGRGQLRK